MFVLDRQKIIGLNFVFYKLKTGKIFILNFGSQSNRFFMNNYT